MHGEMTMVMIGVQFLVDDQFKKSVVWGNCHIFLSYKMAKGYIFIIY